MNRNSAISTARHRRGSASFGRPLRLFGVTVLILSGVGAAIYVNTQTTPKTAPTPSPGQAPEDVRHIHDPQLQDEHSTAALESPSKHTHDELHDHSDSTGKHAHDQSSHAHDEAQSLELSKQAMGNIGLTAEYLRPIQLETFQRTITVPAIIVERPGRTRLEVATPMAGVVTHVHAVQGEAIAAGSLLFELRITAEELVSTQTKLLQTIGELDVESREIARLADVTRSGAVAQKAVIEREYAREKLEVLLAAQKEALRLQGLSERQIEEIQTTRHLLRDLRIVAPSPDNHDHEELQLTRSEIQPTAYGYLDSNEEPIFTSPEDATLLLQELRVHKGEIVPAGATLAVVGDLSELLIEGRAFEQDSELLTEAANRNWKVTAVLDRAERPSQLIENLELLYSASEVDVNSRTLRFYVRLPNTIIRNVPSPNGQRYIEWRHRPGQRLQLRVPVEEWEQQIVLPVDAVAQEGAETFVFQRNSNHFDRVPVRVVYRDQANVVIKNDGSIAPGKIIARRGAHQLQMALKNKSGSGVDPHAGHTH